MMKKILLPIILAVALSWAGCFSHTSEETIGVVGEPEVIQDGERIVIVDLTGKEWDVTDAVKTYGFDLNLFDHGLGPIPAIVEPEMLSPGDAGYPDDGADVIVIGATIGGESRAYPIHVLDNHEVADDTFGDTHVAVAW
jgi:hypothetical protein